MDDLFYLVEDNANSEQDPIKLKLSSGNYGPSIDVLHSMTNQVMASVSLNYFDNRIQVLCFAMLPDGSASEEVTSQTVLIEDYQSAISRGLTE